MEALGLHLDPTIKKDEAMKNPATLTLEAKPTPVEVELAKTAVIVVDMQNDFGSKGGYMDRAGIDISGIRDVIAPTAKVLDSARAIGVPVIFIKAGIHPDLSDLGEPGSPRRERWLADGVGKSVKTPDGREGRILIRDTWNTDIIPELTPHPQDVVVYKSNYSAFHRTELDDILKQMGIRYLIVTGCTTSACVESTIRDAYHRDYSCILLSDCTAEPIGPGAQGYRGVENEGKATFRGLNYEATLVLVKAAFGWVSDSESVVNKFDSVAGIAKTA